MWPRLGRPRAPPVRRAACCSRRRMPRVSAMPRASVRRAAAQALAREMELAARRLASIAADHRSWSERNDGATAQIATLAARLEETTAERAGLEEAPRLFEEKRRALIGEIESAEALRR